MATHLAKDRPKPTKEELNERSTEEDIFAQDEQPKTEAPPIPEPVDRGRFPFLSNVLK